MGEGQSLLRLRLGKLKVRRVVVEFAVVWLAVRADLGRYHDCLRFVSQNGDVRY